MNKTEQETPFSEETIKFRPHIVYKFVGPFHRPRRLLKGWHLFPFHPVDLNVDINSGQAVHRNVVSTSSHEQPRVRFISVCISTTIAMLHFLVAGLERGDPIPWPARSPDLNPLRYFYGNI